MRIPATLRMTTRDGSTFTLAQDHDARGAFVRVLFGPREDGMLLGTIRQTGPRAFEVFEDGNTCGPQLFEMVRRLEDMASLEGWG